MKNVEIKSVAKNKKHQISFIQNQSRNQFLFFFYYGENGGYRSKEKESRQVRAKIDFWVWSDFLVLISGKGNDVEGEQQRVVVPLNFFLQIFLFFF